jgi:hypothetical protein
MKDSVQRETAFAIGEWLPELLCLVTDLLIPMYFGHGNSVGGISVAGIVMGASSRLIGAWTGIIKVQACKVEGGKRKQVLGNLWWTALMALVMACVLWVSRDFLEAYLALPGIGEYLLYGAWYWLMFRACVIGGMALGINQVGMGFRVGLSWIVCTLNVVLTWYFVKWYGVKGSSLATLISTAPTLIILTVWSLRSGLVGRPSVEGLAGIWPMTKERLKGEVPALFNSFTALQLNSWMGPELAVGWSLMHLACDVAGGIGMVVWSVSAKHLTFFTYGDGDNASKGWSSWAWGDRWASGVQVIGAVVAYFFVPYAVFIILAYGFNKRFKFLVEARGTKASEMKIKEAKYAWSIACILGYWMCMALLDPTVIVPTIVYCVAATGSVIMMTR